PSVKPVEHSIPAANHKTDIPKPKSHGNSRNKKACFVYKSLTHLIKDCDYSEKKMAQTPVRNHAHKGNHQHYARMMHPNLQRHVIPTALLTKSKLVLLTAARPVTTVILQPHVTRPRPAKTVVTKPHSPPRRNINRRPSPKPSNFPHKVTTATVAQVNDVKGVQRNWAQKPKCSILDHDNLQHALKDKGVIDSRCSRHMIGNMSYLSDFEPINGGYVAFGGNLKGGKITGKDSLLPILFWAEAVNTAYYVQNRVLVTKPHNKTPYELLLGRTPSISFMRPFGCLVTILNTLDPLGKFDGKADEEFLVGYCVSRSGPTWLFDIDTLIKSMNYQPVTAGNQSNPSAGVQEQFDVEKAKEENVQQYVFFPLWLSGSKDPQNTDGDAAFKAKEPEFEGKKPKSVVHVSPSSSAKTKKHDDKTKREAKGKSLVELSTWYRNLSAEFKDFSDNSINEVNVVDTPVPTVGQISTNITNIFSVVGPSNIAVSPTLRESLYVDPSQYHDDPNMLALEDITYSDDDEDVGAEDDFTNLETTITVSPIPITRVHKYHPVTQIIGDLSLATQTRSMTRVVKDQEELKRVHQAFKDPSWIKAMQEGILQFKMQKEEGIDYKEVFAPVARIEAIRLFLAYASFMGFMVYQMDIKSALMYGTIEEKVYVCQPPGSEDPNYPDKVYKVVKALYGLHQAPRAWYETLANYLLENGFQRGKIDQTLFIKKKKGDILLVRVYVDDIIFVKQKQDGIFISQDKYVAEILRKFGLTDGKAASTPIDTEKPLLKDLDDSDYAGASLDRKSTTGGCQFFGCRLISWQCKKQTIVATLSTEAEYVAAARQTTIGKETSNPFMVDASEGFDQITDFLNASAIKYALTVNPNIYVPCIKQFWSSVSVKNVNDVTGLQALIDRKKVIITEATVQKSLRLDDVESIDCLPNEEIFTELSRMGLVRNVDSSSKFFYVSMIPTTDDQSTSMIVAQQADDVADEVAASVDVDDVPAADVEPTLPSPTPTTQPPPPQELPSTSQVAPTPPSSPIAQPSSPPHQPQPSQPTIISMDLLNNLLETCTTLIRRIKNFEQDKIAQALDITRLKQRVKRLKKKNKVKVSG
nr:hypothetical protein [Tanacetum cinerariifolium]